MVIVVLFMRPRTKSIADGSRCSYINSRQLPTSIASGFFPAVQAMSHTPRLRLEISSIYEAAVQAWVQWRASIQEGSNNGGGNSEEGEGGDDIFDGDGGDYDDDGDDPDVHQNDDNNDDDNDDNDDDDNDDNDDDA